MHKLKRFFFAILAIILVFEEWLWDALTVFGRKLAVWLHLQKFEAWLRLTPPSIAVIAFVIPLLIVTPFNIAAIWLLARGCFLRAILVEIFAKLLGTVLIARVFALTKPQLLTFAWFRALYTTINGWLTWAHTRLRNTAAYRSAHKFKDAVRKAFAWFKN